MNHFFAPSQLSLEELPMKSFLRVLFILALFCGVSSFAHAAEIDFHVQVLDPANTCDPTTSFCTIIDPSQTLQVTFLEAACTPFGIVADGCLVLANNTLSTTFTNLSLSFTVPAGTNATCGTDGTNFASAICGASGGIANFFFSGGPGLAPLHEFVISESGIDPAELVGTASVNTPEPESLLLFSTGALMMAAGLLMKRQRGFAFSKK
jgi:hypothetical protein